MGGACKQCNDWQLALNLLDDMEEATVAANVITYVAAIDACEKGSQWPWIFNLRASLARMVSRDCTSGHLDVRGWLVAWRRESDIVGLPWTLTADGYFAVNAASDVRCVADLHQQGPMSVLHVPA